MTVFGDRAFKVLSKLNETVTVGPVQSNWCSNKQRQFRHTDRLQGSEKDDHVKRQREEAKRPSVSQRERPQEKPVLLAP